MTWQMNMSSMSVNLRIIIIVVGLKFIHSVISNRTTFKQNWYSISFSSRIPPRYFNIFFHIRHLPLRSSFPTVFHFTSQLSTHPLQSYSPLPQSPIHPLSASLPTHSSSSKLTGTKQNHQAATHILPSTLNHTPTHPAAHAFTPAQLPKTRVLGLRIWRTWRLCHKYSVKACMPTQIYPS
jgi:hypothetical protein